jgi:hypothetical protein
MKKGRKTKKQKLRAESRRHSPEKSVQTETVQPRVEEHGHTHVTHSLGSISLPTFSSPSTRESTMSKTRYSYVVHDVRNTLTILAIIIAANVVLYMLIQQGIIKLAW